MTSGEGRTNKMADLIQTIKELEREIEKAKGEKYEPELSTNTYRDVKSKILLLENRREELVNRIDDDLLRNFWRYKTERSTNQELELLRKGYTPISPAWKVCQYWRIYRPNDGPHKDPNYTNITAVNVNLDDPDDEWIRWYGIPKNKNSSRSKLWGIRPIINK